MIRLMGGLGNQMFQYAFGLSMAIENQIELVLDDTLLYERSNDHLINTHRDFELMIFKNLSFRWAKPEEVFLYNGNPKSSKIKKLIRKINNFIDPKRLIIQKNNEIDPYLSSFKNNSCYVGRWQSHIFFKNHEEQIRNSFELIKPSINGIDKIIEDVTCKESVCLHFRRGDLVTSPLYSKTIGVLDMEYYIKAVSFIQQNVLKPVFFVFSDDINWCKQNLKFEVDLVFVDESFAGNRSEGHFYLMQHCKHFIISNSTFAWWTAFLSNNKLKKVVYPKNWYKSLDLSNPEMSPKDWTAL